jgi:hypothetical protein
MSIPNSKLHILGGPSALTSNAPLPLPENTAEPDPSLVAAGDKVVSAPLSTVFAVSLVAGGAGSVQEITTAFSLSTRHQYVTPVANIASDHL